MRTASPGVGVPAAVDVRWRRHAVAFSVVAVAVFASVLPLEGRDHAGAAIASTALGLVVALAVGLALRERLPRWSWVPVAWVFLAAVGLLRAAAGGSAGGVGALAILPAVWFALHGRRRELHAALAGIAVVWGAPLLLIGGPEYPASGWRALVLLVVLASLIGVAVQQIVADDREHLGALMVADAERERLLRELDVLAHRDPLTGLLNRRAWHRTLRDAVSAPAPEPVCVAVLDLDGLKAINDRAGHAAGDAALRAAAAAWQDRLRDTDVLARLGGDEFGLLLRGCDRATAQELLERFNEEGLPACSIGVAQWDGAESAGALQSRADTLMYQAKAAGRRCVAEAPAA